MAYAFNGTNQSLETSSTPVTAEGITLAHNFLADAVSGAKFMFNISSAGNSSLFSTRRNSDGALACQKTQPDGVGATANSEASQYTSGTQYHLTGTYTSTTARAIFLNGTSVGTSTTSITAINTSGQRVVIGRLGNSNNAGSGEGYHNGQLSECAIWNVALTDAEIASLAKGFKPTRIRPQSLVFYAPLIRTLQDTRGGLTITNNNSATVADHPRVY